MGKPIIGHHSADYSRVLYYCRVVPDSTTPRALLQYYYHYSSDKSRGRKAVFTNGSCYSPGLHEASFAVFKGPGLLMHGKQANLERGKSKNVHCVLFVLEWYFACKIINYYYMCAKQQCQHHIEFCDPLFFVFVSGNCLQRAYDSK